MFESFRNSWQLVKASWAVLQADKELVWFPVLSAVTLIVVMMILAVPFGIFAFVTGADIGGDGFEMIFGAALLFVYYLIAASISTYFNVALAGAVMIRFDGGDPTMKDGFEVAGRSRGVIVRYAMVAATVGVILNIIEERFGFLGDVLSFLGGVAWNVATFLVVPIIAAGEVAAFDALKRSAALLKQTWGQQIVGNFTIGGITTLIFIAWMVVAGGLVFFLGNVTESPVIVIVGIIIVVLGLIVISVVSSALEQIYRVAVFRYAELGEAPGDFDIEVLRQAFKPKNKRGII